MPNNNSLTLSSTTITFKSLGQACPVCGHGNLSCRTLDTGVIYCDSHKTKSEPRLEGYQLRVDRQGLYYLSPSTKEWTPEQRDARERQLKAQAKRKEELRKQALSIKPTAEHTDTLFRRMARNKPIKRAINNFLARGLTMEYINSMPFAEVNNDTKVAKSTDTPFAGIDFNGVWRSYSSTVIPIRNVDGLVIGSEIMPFNGKAKYLHPVTNSRYVGGKFDIDYKTIDNERPIDFNLGEDTDIVFVTEGTLKPKVANQRLGITTIGTTGGMVWQGMSQLESIVSRYPNATYVLALDAGMAMNSNILLTTERNHKAFASLGIELKILDYGQWYGGYDIDEIAELGDYQLRSLEELQDAGMKRFNEKTKLTSSDQYTTNKDEAVIDGLVRLIEAAAKQGKKHILFNAPTGTGKTHTATQYMKQLDTPVAYLARSVKYPDNDGLKIAERLPTRNTEIDTDEYLGNIMQENNCFNTEHFSKAYNQGISTAGICKSCPFFKKCQQSSGEGFGFIHQFQRTVKAPKILATPQGYQAKYMPAGATLILEESSALTSHRTYKASLADINAISLVINQLDINLAEYKQLTRLIQITDSQVRANKTKHNVDIDVDAYSEVDVEALLLVLPKLEDAINLNNKGLLKKGMALYNWIQPLVERLTKQVNNQITYGNGGIDITVLDNNFREVTKLAKTVIHLDATATVESIALKYGIGKEEIVQYTIRKPDYRNVDFQYIEQNASKDLGAKGSDTLGNIVDAIQARHTDNTIGIIDHKQRTHKLDYSLVSGATLTHWSDARGSNLFETKDIIIQLGMGRANLGAILTEYNLYSGLNVTKEDSGFQKYYADLNVANQLQEIGRIRSMIRKDEKLVYYVVDKYKPELPYGIEFTTVEVEEDLHIKPYTHGETTKRRIINVAARMVAAGKKLTQATLAHEVNKTAGTVKYQLNAIGMDWKEFTANAVLLADKIYQGNELTEDERNMVKIALGNDLIDELKLAIDAEQDDLPTSRYEEDKRLIDMLIISLPKHFRKTIINKMTREVKRGLGYLQHILIDSIKLAT